MGTIYYIEETKKWRAMIRHKGYKSISMYFDNLAEAQKFCNNAEREMKVKIKERKITFLMDALKEKSNE
jgi:outer membrane protein assembly factor BamE (lipoprotein component of BamABCDE complex)